VLIRFAAALHLVLSQVIQYSKQNHGSKEERAVLSNR